MMSLVEASRDSRSLKCDARHKKSGSIFPPLMTIRWTLRAAHESGLATFWITASRASVRYRTDKRRVPWQPHSN
jgi:hypothetical protein